MAGLLVFVFCVLVMATNVKADVIWEPENSFYKMHTKDCVYHNRNYIVNGPEGKVIIYKSPEVNLKLSNLVNGKSVNIYYLYEASDGVLWGLYDNWKTNVTGWIPMDYMELEYDHICFVEEFGEEIQTKTENLPAEYIGKEIYIWSYPGSENATTFVPKGPMEFTDVFEDEEGNIWGHIGYYYGWRNIWVCIDNPRAGFSELYPDEKPIREVDSDHVIPSDEDIVPTKGVFEIILIVALLVSVVVVVTWKILVKMKKRS
jgi:hypothetical protein